VATLQGLKHIYTKVQDGVRHGDGRIPPGKPTQEALDDVRSAVARVRADLPGDLRDPIVTKMDLAGAAGAGLHHCIEPHGRRGAVLVCRQRRGQALLTVRGVGAVATVWAAWSAVKCMWSSTRLKLLALGTHGGRHLAPAAPGAAGAAGGRTDLGGSEQSVRTLATVQTPRSWPRCVVALSDGRRCAWTSWPRCATRWPSRAPLALLDGQPVVGFEVTRSKGAERGGGRRRCAGRTGRAARTSTPTWKSPRPSTSSTPVQEEYDGSMHLLYEGALLAVLVVWLFLRDARATFVSAVALPLSVIPAFIGMYLLGFSINVITLLALSLVVGILVDDAIVEVENIVRHLRMGKTPTRRPWRRPTRSAWR
jgi:multidrug efflux pump subunit AcrB